MKYILRIYDSELDKQVQDGYQKVREQFPNTSMNAYLTELVKKGTGLDSPVSDSNESVEQLLTTALEVLIEGFKKEQRENDVITRLLSSIYALMLAKNEEGYLSKQKVEEGFYDDLPKRFQ